MIRADKMGKHMHSLSNGQPDGPGAKNSRGLLPPGQEQERYANESRRLAALVRFARLFPHDLDPDFDGNPVPNLPQA